MADSYGYANPGKNDLIVKGNVGIGTSAPQLPLDVAGTVRISSIGDGVPILNLSIERSWAFRQLGSGSNTALELASIGGGGNKNFVINTTGYVGIGTTAPQARLHVSATSGVEDILFLGFDDGTGLAFDFHGIEARYGGGLQTMFLNANGGNVVISTGSNIPARSFRVVNATCDGNTWINASDRHLKERFEPVNAQDVLARLAALSIHRWSYTNSPNTRHLGPTAQDFHAAFGFG